MLKINSTAGEKRIREICTNYYQCRFDDFTLSTDKKEHVYITFNHNMDIDDRVVSFVSDDRMKLTALFLPKINKGRAKTFEEAYEEAFFAANIKEEFIDKSTFKRMFTAMSSGIIKDSVVLAKGNYPVHSNNSRVIYYVETGIAEEINEENLNEAKKYLVVRRGQMLAKVIPPSNGNDGVDVYGEAIPKKDISPVNIATGQGVRKSENIFFAEEDGYVTFKSGNLSVVSQITINHDVDLRLGDIDFIGKVIVNGDVLSGRTIRANEIVVSGVCQNATLAAENDIIVGGVKGADGAFSLTAGRDIFAGYCENSRLYANNNITIDKYSFNSVLHCGGSIYADNNTTFAGGAVISFTGGSFFTVGTRGNADILITAGRKFNSDEKINRIKDEKNRLTETIKNINEQLGMFNLKDPKVLKNTRIQKLISARELALGRIEYVDRLTKSIEEQICAEPSFKISNEIYEGVRVKMFDKSVTVEKTRKGVEFYYDNVASDIMTRILSQTVDV